jgi:hypothetical protein
MTYEESADLMQNMTFRGRCKVAALKFADAIVIEEASVAGHNGRLRWAQQVFQQPEIVAAQVQPPTVMDGAVQSAGQDVTDQALQGAVEAVVNKML